MNIKYGSIEYFTLLDLQDKLKYWDYKRLGLLTLDTLITEVDMKRKAIELAHTEEISKKSPKYDT